MSRTWFTSDLHFGHENILRLCPERRGETIDEHDHILVDNWNAVVAPDDDVHVLGDFALRCHPARMAEIFNALKGRKHLTIGNHDNGATLSLKWASEPTPYRELQLELQECGPDGKPLLQRIVLCHYAMRTWNQAHRGAIMLYGHSHGNLPAIRNSLDVGVDAWDGRPVSLEMVRERLNILFPPEPQGSASDDCQP